MPAEVPHTSREEQRLYEQLSPFELKSRLTELADLHDSTLMLKAGRGNPNWIATTPREAFFLLGRFAMGEARRTWDEPGLAGQPAPTGVAARLATFLEMHRDEGGVDLLEFAVEYGTQTKSFDPDEWVHELVDAIIGDNYPSPDRMLTCVEQVVNDYLMAELCGGPGTSDGFDLFAVEGGTAAMCYLFETLAANDLLRPGDRIALGAPIFTPYLEIPDLPRYGFDVVHLAASEVDEEGRHTWQYPDSEIDKLADPSIRALFLVNPSNPPSVMLDPRTLDRIASTIATWNPNLIVISDDVYGPFVPGFRSLMAAAPRNTIGVYSFSKYFGCTGWRLGVIAVHRDNILDELLTALPADDRESLSRRYAPISLEPEKLRIIDRIVADSRHVALNHTAGLSLPQQVQMVLFALASLADTDDSYRTRLRQILRHRLEELHLGLDADLPENPLQAGYYVELDLLLWAKRTHGDSFVNYLLNNYEPVDVVFRLAEQESVVLLNGGGFDAPEWSVRISMANLPDRAYRRIGQAINRILGEYVVEWRDAGGAERT